MSKDQPCLSKHSLCASSSKNAKDKCNSTTLLAMRNAAEEASSRGRGSCCGSEKDSGYSDSSDWQQTDGEEQQSNKNLPRGSEHAETPQPSPKQDAGKLENPSVMPVGRELSPVYIFNNIVLKQPDMVQKGGQLAQGTLNMETTPSGGTHMIILQQPSLLLATFQLPEPSSQKTRPTRKKANGTYLPILNSYPRIAPHPSKKPPDKSPSSNKSQTVFKRVCTEHKSDDTPVTISLLEQHFNKQPKLAVSTSRSPCSSSTRGSLSPCSPETISSSLGSPSSSSVNHSTSSPGRGSATTRHRRFLNTVEILRQSGLLDITLRTKELLRQSNATERDIAQLRQHTELLCKAVGDPSCSQSDVAALEHLLRSMAESGSYPNLKVPQNHQSLCHPGSTSQMESISTSESSGPRVVKSSEVSSAQFIAAATGSNICCPAVQQSHQGHGRELEARSKSVEKVTFMPPDSSTG